MYCGKEMEIAEKVTAMIRVEHVLKDFNRDDYADSFEQYYRKYVPILEEITDIYAASGNSEEVITKIADKFIISVHKEIDSIKKKSAKESQIMDYSLTMVVYVLPSMLEYKGTAMESLTDELVTLWHERFPQNLINKSTFEEINQGFKRKLCYITTAVCESLGRSDDCLELNLLRNYRDTYLLSCEDGAKIVEEYYDIAPTIVNRINKMSDSSSAYLKIWEQYLKDCVQLIQNNKKEQCKEVYSSMVNNLIKEYILQ